MGYSDVNRFSHDVAIIIFWMNFIANPDHNKPT